MSGRNSATWKAVVHGGLRTGKIAPRLVTPRQFSWHIKSVFFALVPDVHTASAPALPSLSVILAPSPSWIRRFPSNCTFSPNSRTVFYFFLGGGGEKKKKNRS